MSLPPEDARESRDQPLTQIFAAALGGSDFHADQELRRGDWHLRLAKHSAGSRFSASP